MGSVIRELDVDNRYSPEASSYDRFSAGLIASILLTGFVVLSLLTVWLFGNDHPVRHAAFPVYPGEKDVDQGGGEQELDSLPGSSSSTELVSLVESVEEAVTQTQSQDGGPGGLIGPGTPGIPNPIRIPQMVPPAQRWKISYEVESIEQYKRQLDFFDIEIGVVASHKSDVWRVGSLSSDATVTYSNRTKEGSSVWFAHTKPALKRWDRRIANESGLLVEEMLFVQFYPAAVQSQIASLEVARLAELGRELDEVLETNIKISGSGDGFEISISGFEFR